MIAVLAGLIGPMAWFSPNSLAVAMPLLTLAVLWRGGWQGVRPVVRLWPELLLVLVIAAISLIWTPVLKTAAANYGKLVIGFVFGLILVRHAPRLLEQERLVQGLALGLGLGAVVILMDAATGWPLVLTLRPGTLPKLESGFYSRGGAFAALFLPLLTFLLIQHKRRLAAAGLVLVSVPAILVVHGVAAKISLMAGILALPVLWAAPVLGWIGPGILAASLLLATVPFPVRLDPQQTCDLIARQSSAYHRLLIWGFVSELIRNEPVTGYGFDSARSLPQGRQSVDIRFCDDDSGFYQRAELLPMHPHNGALQVRLELGWIGTAAIAFALFALARRSLRGPRAQRTMAGLIWIGALPMVLLSYGVWQEWWIATLALAAALAAGARSEGARSDNTNLPKV